MIKPHVDIVTDDLENIEDYFQLLDMDDLVVVHPYDGDMDDQLLEEIQPRWIIAYEPDSAFIRRIEVYRSSHNNRNIKAYFMYYVGSVEEQRFLSTTRKEKDDFERLIKERAVSNRHTLRMLLPTDCCTEYGDYYQPQRGSC